MAMALGVLAADQVALDEELAIDAGQIVDLDVDQIVRLLDSENLLPKQCLDPVAIGIGRTPDERIIGQIARKADPTAHHDVGLRTGAPQPFAGVLG
jgi:hypothetical protein